MDEASKTLRILPAACCELLVGKGIDIGCGRDPVRPDARRFDLADGDANRITDFVDGTGSFDYVFSSHCLEHMRDPRSAVQEWWRLVRPGGAMVVVVPDEDLYEQGYWPPIFNTDHKATFTLAKQSSWSPVSISLQELVSTLPDAQLIQLQLQDQGYRRSRLAHGMWARGPASLAVRLRAALRRRMPWLSGMVDATFALLRLPIDQTMGDAVAQIVLAVRKGGR